MSIDEPSESHPPWRGARLMLREARERGGGPVAGRYLRGRTRDLLEDRGAVVELEPTEPRPGHGDQVAGELRVERGRGLERLRLLSPRVLSPARREPAPELRELARQRPALEARARILAGLRTWFVEQDFLEVETPARVANPGLEPHLRPFPAGLAGDGAARWLITSPELHLKRFLAAGYERVVELARAFRDDERGALHGSEFALLEWYRSHAGLDELAADCAGLLGAAAAAAGRDPASAVEGCDLALEPERIGLSEAFARAGAPDPHGLPAEERERLFVESVEPGLGFGRPCLVEDWPADAAALARLRREPTGRLVACRMELYVAGVELANGFDELTDPAEQRRRHEADREARRAAGAPAPPLDEGFLAALEAGLPPSAGMALGLDRLVMLLLGKDRIAAVRAFAEP